MIDCCMAGLADIFFVNGPDILLIILIDFVVVIHLLSVAVFVIPPVIKVALLLLSVNDVLLANGILLLDVNVSLLLLNVNVVLLNRSELRSDYGPIPSGGH